MPSIRIINENGDFEVREVTTGGVTFEMDNGDLFEPAVVDRLEFDDENGMSQIKWDACRKVQNRKESDKKADITVEGVVTESQLGALKALDQQTDLTITSDLFSGPVAVKRVTIEQNSRLVEFISGGDAELAFRFQCQIKVSQYEDTVTTIPVEDTIYSLTSDE